MGMRPEEHLLLERLSYERCSDEPNIAALVSDNSRCSSTSCSEIRCSVLQILEFKEHGDRRKTCQAKTLDSLPAHGAVQRAEQQATRFIVRCAQSQKQKLGGCGCRSQR